MTRYRLRFLLREVDLRPGETTVGRGGDCGLSLDDPLVSRRHARIVASEDGVVIEDAGSRNGVLVNGVTIRTPTPLRNADRVRVGTQEFIFCRLDADSPATETAKATGQLRLCATCGAPYPREALTCPRCEDEAQIEEDTFTGVDPPDLSRTTTVQLLVESLRRALALGRLTDAQRLVQRASDEVGYIVAAGGSVDAEVLRALAMLVGELRDASGKPIPVYWALDAWRR